MATRSRIRFMTCSLSLGLLFPLLAIAQQQLDQAQAESAREHPVRVKKAAVEAEREAPKIKEEHRLAYQTLEASEAAARSFEAPMRSYGLLQIGSTYATLDAAKARVLLREAFTASLEIRDDADTKERMQQEILRSLLPLSQPDVEELVQQAEAKVRRPITDLIVGNYAKDKQFVKGIELINQMAAVDEFPYGSAGRLMDAMPPEMTAEKQALFMQAAASYKSHEHPGALIGSSTFSGMINRFWMTMPPGLVLQAVDEILSQAKSKADQDIRIAGTGGSAAFASDYQYQLFALMPVIRKLDESRAKQLLEDNQDLQAKMQQFPDGMNSLMPPPPAQDQEKNSKNPGASTTSMSLSFTSTSDHKGSSPAPPASGGPPIGFAADYQRRVLKSKQDAIFEEVESNPVQAIADSLALPLQDNYGPPQKNSPRAGSLEMIARYNVKKNPKAAQSALAELRKVVADLPSGTQAQYLATAADFYLQMDEKETAEKVVAEGFKVAEKMLEGDVNPDSPNQALKAWWPSTDAYRRFVEVETRISDRATLNVLKEIKDPEIRATESIMFARSLLGLPLKRFTVVEKRGDQTHSYTTDGN